MVAEKSASHYDAYSEIDVICPTAVEPGTFFTCQLYVLDEEFVKAEIADNITGTTEDETGWVRVPSKYILQCDVTISLFEILICL